MHIKPVLLKISRIIGWTFFIVFVLLITVILLIRVPAIQNRIAQKAITYLEEKIKTNVELKSITIDFPKKIVIEGLYVEDLKKDTLLYAGRIAVDASMMELFRNQILLNRVEIENTRGSILRTLPDSTFNFDYIIDAFSSNGPSSDTTTTGTPWTFSIGDVDLTNVQLKYDDAVTKMSASANVGTLEVDTDKADFDALRFLFNGVEIKNTRLAFSNDSTQFQITGLRLSATDLKYDSINIEADVDDFSFHEGIRNLDLKKLSGFARLKGTVVELGSIALLFGNSELNISGKVNYQSFSGDVDISSSKIALSDILLFQGDLLDSLPVNIPRGAVVLIDAKVNGDTTLAKIESLHVRTLDSTLVSLHGTYSKDKLDLALTQCYTSGSDVRLMLSDTLLPAMPKWVTLEGTVKGSIHKPIIVSTLATDLGSVTADGQIELLDVPKYVAKVTAKSIQAGKLSGQPGLGDVNFILNVDGAGFSMKDIHTKVDLVVKDIVYNNYRFTDFKLNGSVDKFLFSGKAELNDENLDFELNADLDYNGDIPVYKAQLDLRNADLRELNISEQPLKARLTIDVDLTTNDFKVMNGRLDIRKVAVFNGEKLYSVDSMLFASLDQEGHSKMSIRSDILTGDFEGSFNIFSVPDVLQHHFDRYFSSAARRSDPEGPPQNFTFDLKIRNTDLITEVLIPNLEPFTPGVIRGEFDSEEHRLNVVFRMPRLKYNNTSVDSLVFLVNSDADELRYFTKLENVVADTITIHQVNLAGNISRDSIRATLNVLDSLDEKKYRIGTRIVRSNGLMNVHLNDSLLLNYSPWNVPADNYLAIGKGVVVANHFEITKQRQKVVLLGDTRKDAAITVRFEELELGNLTHIISGIVPASGELNGDLKFNTSGNGEFNSKLSVTGLTVLEVPVGDLTLSLDHSADQYNVLLNLRGNRTTMETKGTYGGPKGAATLDLVANISQLNMEVVQAFSMGQLHGAEGSLKGHVQIKGKPSHPDIDGNLTFFEVSVVPTYVNSKFELKNETIAIHNDNITLNNFMILDGQGNKAILKGNINIARYRNPVFDLTLNTKDFQVLDTKEGDNDLFYGRVKINSSAQINGSAAHPKANFKLRFTDDTNFTYVVPTSEKGVLEAKGIVNFVDKDAVNDPFLATIDASDSIHTTFGGMEVNAVIDLSDKEILNIVIDPITGDKLSIQGNSTFTFDMTSSGNMNLSGRYEISRGSYNFSFYNLVKRKFDIVKGSTITWSGDPLNATMDIRASNTVDASPLELLSAVGPTNYDFNQRLPFLVYLNIKGMLLVPQITFNLDIPADKRNAFGGMLYSKLQDINSRESDLNKQVFALLILRRFVSDNPLESTTGSTNVARTSVSRILSEQLNRLSSNVKGVQLSVDIKSYEDITATGGAQGTTKAQLGVSKSLLGNRLVVKLSGNVDIEGQNAGSNNVTDYIGDLALEYKMTEDGRFRVTGFRNSNYDMIDGELTETGAGLIYIKDYNTLRELFKANERQIP